MWDEKRVGINIAMPKADAPVKLTTWVCAAFKGMGFGRIWFRKGSIIINFTLSIYLFFD